MHPKHSLLGTRGVAMGVNGLGLGLLGSVPVR